MLLVGGYRRTHCPEVQAGLFRICFAQFQVLIKAIVKLSLDATD